MSHSQQDVRLMIDFIKACRPLATMEIFDLKAPDEAICIVTLGTVRSIREVYNQAIAHFGTEEPK